MYIGWMISDFYKVIIIKEVRWSKTEMIYATIVSKNRENMINDTAKSKKKRNQ